MSNHRPIPGIVAAIVIGLALLAALFVASARRTEDPENRVESATPLVNSEDRSLPRAAEPPSGRAGALRHELPGARPPSNDRSSEVSGGAEHAWRVRVVDEQGATLLRYEARWLNDDSLAAPGARRFSAAHEGQRQRVFQELGTPLRPDASGLGADFVSGRILATSVERNVPA